ncbi:hypothetical protein QYF36_009387 [Acer negundo]|nr:hypothetical protein QYF36_009387 [Acer negundo]
MGFDTLTDPLTCNVKLADKCPSTVVIEQGTRKYYKTTTAAYCGTNCQSQCRQAGPTPTPTVPSGGGGGGDVGSIISQTLFNSCSSIETMLDALAMDSILTMLSSPLPDPSTGLAQQVMPTFGGGNSQLSWLKLHTKPQVRNTGGWANAPDGPYAWGYCFIRERNNPGTFCTSPDWPCPPGRQYFGRGPIQLTHYYNYGQAGTAIRADLINNPDLVATDPVISFRTAIWFWMTPQGNKPSSHNVITERWTPSDADRSANRVPGYGVITNIINGGKECQGRANDKVASRIGFYRRYCNILGVSYGNNLDCYNQRPFA